MLNIGHPIRRRQRSKLKILLFTRVLNSRIHPVNKYSENIYRASILLPLLWGGACYIVRVAKVGCVNQGGRGSPPVIANPLAVSATSLMQMCIYQAVSAQQQYRNPAELNDNKLASRSILSIHLSCYVVTCKRFTCPSKYICGILKFLFIWN